MIPRLGVGNAVIYQLIYARVCFLFRAPGRNRAGFPGLQNLTSSTKGLRSLCEIQSVRLSLPGILLLSYHLSHLSVACFQAATTRLSSENRHPGSVCVAASAVMAATRRCLPRLVLQYRSSSNLTTSDRFSGLTPESSFVRSHGGRLHVTRVWTFLSGWGQHRSPISGLEVRHINQLCYTRVIDRGGVLPLLARGTPAVILTFFLPFSQHVKEHKTEEGRSVFPGALLSP